MTNHIFPACEAMASPIRAERDLCANALCSSSEIALMLRVVVEAVCILPCYAAIGGQAKLPGAMRMIAVASFPFEQWAIDNQCDVTPAVVPAKNRVYADRQTQVAFDVWNAGKQHAPTASIGELKKEAAGIAMVST